MLFRSSSTGSVSLENADRGRDVGFIFLIFFFNVYSFLRDRETECEQGRGRERERERETELEADSRL